MSKAERERLTRLILGELPEEERERIEASLLLERNAFGEALDAEEEVIEAYIRGDLSEDQHRAWEARMAASPAAARRVELARALGDAATRRAAAPAPGFRWRRVVEWIFGSPVLAWRPALAAAAVTALTVGVWGRLELSSMRMQLAEERASAEEGRRADQARIDELARRLEKAAASRRPAPTFSLGLAGATRGTSGAPRLALPSDADALRLEADLEGTGLYVSLRATLRTASGEQVFSHSPLDLRTAAGFTTVTVTVPTALLQPGAYVLVLEGSAPTRGRETAAVFEFVLVKR